MKHVTYVKYNSLRCPSFRIRTDLYEEDGKRFASKTAMQKEAVPHIARIRSGCDRLSGLYRDIIPLKYCDDPCEESVVFPFIEGETLLSSIDFENSKTGSVLSAVSKMLDKIFDYPGPFVPFKMTDEFAKMFPDCTPSEYEDCSPITNLDSNPDNFIISNGNIYCIDSEWVYEFPIPVRFVRFRALLYIYTKMQVYLRDRISAGDFYHYFGFNGKDIELFTGMEDCFQQYVHGKGRKYIYTGNYEKTYSLFKEHEEEAARNAAELCSLKPEAEALRAEVEELQKKVAALTEQNNAKDAYIEHIRKAMHNPAYAAKVAAKKTGSKIKHTFDGSSSNNGQPAELESMPLYSEEEVRNYNYETWMTDKEIADEKAREKDSPFAYNPLISVLVPVYNVLDKHLIPCIESVLNQTYKNIELCLSDDNSSFPNVKETLKKYESDERVKVVYRSENGRISRNTNSALEVASGEFCALLDCDDTLAPFALYEVVKKLNENRSLDFIYSDEDKIDDDGKERRMPHFKPDWSPDTFFSHMYTCHLGVYRTSIIRKIGGFRPECDGSQDYDLTLRFTEQTTPDKIAHIPLILYHWRERVESTSADIEAKPYVIEAARKAKEDALRRRNISADLEYLPTRYQWRVNYIPQGFPLVSIIIPSKDHPDVLMRCLGSIVKYTEYKNYEIIVVDNGSSADNRKLLEDRFEGIRADGTTIKYVYNVEEFNFSHMCNTGAAAASGSLLLFLNDDTELFDRGALGLSWLSRMAGQASQSHTGAVGAKLLYPDGHTIQHCGIINNDHSPVHAFIGMSDDGFYYFNRNAIEYDWLAVTGACLMISADKFKEAGGFNEDLKVAYNDVDLCLKLVEKGYYNIVRTDVIIKHWESVSRGVDHEDDAKMKRLDAEREKLTKAHPALMERDPFYNPNFTKKSVDFSFDYPEPSLDNYVITKIEGSASSALHDDPRLMGNIDIMFMRNEHVLYVEGWGIAAGHAGEKSVDLLLRSENNTYSITKDPVLREDLPKAFPDEEHALLGGFRTFVDLSKLEKGSYELMLVRGNIIHDLQKSIDVN
ncbi:MAG: glycosyltransferase [Lachnospiraceae bacterium]|nr:glycosyltransferase [Lachnospiraceae bacterium]